MLAMVSLVEGSKELTDTGGLHLKQTCKSAKTVYCCLRS